MNKYKIIALIGEAGSGKDTIMQKVLTHRKEQLHEIVSYTSRPPREGEQDGFNYHFISAEEFMDKIDNGEMIEYSYFNNWFYGTGYKSLSTDKINIGVFNPTGIRKLIERADIDLETFWIQAMPKTRLLRQLNREENPDVYEIVRRFKTDTHDFSNIDFRFKTLVNENVSDKIIAAAALIETADNFN